MSEDVPVIHTSGASSTAVPAYELVPQHALQRLAERFAAGAKKHGKFNYRLGLQDKEYVLERAAHVVHHIYQLIGKLEGFIPPNGDDDAAAVMWGGAFLCEATKEMGVEL